MFKGYHSAGIEIKDKFILTDQLGGIFVKKFLLPLLLLVSLIMNGCNPTNPTIQTETQNSTNSENSITPTTEPQTKASATIINSQKKTIGNATLTEGKEGVQMKLEVKDLPPGKHALHIHENGKCTVPDFDSAGGHFNPEQKKHGKENPEGSHAGDLENIEIPASGELQTTLTIPQVTLKKGEKNSLLKEGNTSIVIHEKADDYKTDPAGNAGKRIACGVIQ